ncbi:uncharacterized protein [Venturia canescens]|uniref:uncharacterized protein isoform X2 n=1 Tax=Venturia canescens TaxID=32260 RepID=UPI001C9C89E9|nr:uncharacterized protein LOC122414663 isoform X2 [Venturia canescens]
MWYILLVGLLAQASGTQVTYHTTSQAQSSASSSSSETKNWSWQEPSASASGQQDDYHPLSFTASDVVDPNQGKQQSPNVQSDSSSVAQVLDQFTQQTVDTVVDDILDSSRRGRNLEGYDELYADPDVKNALQIGNDTIARAYIRDKLCSLGLMNCENNEGRRPFYSPHRDIHPHDIIYAQPVTIKPVGRPLPAIPIKRPYGPAKPVPLPPGIGSGPIYSGPPGPIYSGAPGHFPGPSSSFSGAHHSFPGPYPGYKKPSFGHGTRPVYEAGFDGEYDFEDKFLEKKQVLVQQPTAAGVQQHVHHHYHHGEGDVKNPAVIVGTPGLAGPIVNPGVVSSNGLNSYGYGSSGTYGSGYNDFEDYKKAFKVKTPSNGNSLDPLTSSPSYANRYPTYDKSKRDSIFTSKGFSGGVESTKILSSGFGGGNSFVNQGFGSGNSGFGQGSSSGFIANGGHPSNHGFGTNAGLGSSNGFENYPSNNYEDCLCVPYDQCAGIDHAGRKDDLFLAIDPRNLGKDIEAVEEVVVTDGNGTMSTIRVPKEVNGTEQAENAKEQAAKAADVQTKAPDSTQRSKRDAKQVADTKDKNADVQSRQFGRPPVCGPRHVCCRRNQVHPSYNGNHHGRPRPGQCGVRNTQGINGRIKTPVYVDGDSEFGEYPWQVAILKKDPSESVYVCGGTLISPRHIITAAHCVKTHAGRDLRARLGEWDVNHDVEFFPYIERDIVNVHVHPEFYAGTLYNDIAILTLDHEVDFEKNPHISPACLPDKHDDFTGARCWTTGWGKDAFGDFGKYQNILKEVDVPIVSNQVCEHQMRRTRLGHSFNLHPGFVCAGGEEGKDACKGDGGGPMVCERHGKWQLAGVVSWGIGCGQPGVPGVYSRVSYYLDWITQVVRQY